MNDDPADSENNSRSSQEYDFSDDLNISPVEGPIETSGVDNKGQLPKSVSEAVTRSLSQITNPQPVKTAAPVAPVAPPVFPPVAAPTPAKPSLNRLDKEWPFASPEVLAKEKVPPVAAPAPISIPTPVSVPTPVQAAAPATTPEAAKAVVPHVSMLKNLRTFEGDVAEALSHRPVSKVSIALAENKKKGEGETLRNIGPAAEPKENSHVVLKTIAIIASILLIFGGAFGAYYLYTKSPLGVIAGATPVKTQTGATPALIPYDTQVVINTDGLDFATIQGKIKKEMQAVQPSNTIKEIVLTETKDGGTYRVSAAEMTVLSGIPVPDMIARTLKSEWMLGVSSGVSGIRTPFVVVGTNLFQNAFAGMLAWEQGIPEDLKAFIGTTDVKGTAVAPVGTFNDQIVKNKDVRAFITPDTRTILSYSFVDNSTLVFAANSTVMSALITRLESKAFVR